MTVGSLVSRETHKTGESLNCDRGVGSQREELMPLAGDELGNDGEEVAANEVPEEDVAEGQVDDGAEEDTEPLRTAVTPVLPSQAIQQEHNKTHIPYRSWCSFCNEGRGLGEQRGHLAERPHGIAIVGIDYWFMTDKHLKTRKELSDTHPETLEGEKRLQDDIKAGKVVKCLIIRCHKTKCLFAHVVPCKGIDPDNFCVKLVADVVAWLGHARLILKSDGENSILKLVEQVLREAKYGIEGLETISSEKSPPYDSQGNGGTEVGIRIVRGQLRTLKLQLESRVGHRVPVSHPLMAWLVEHTALILNACARGPDGLTSWARARGRPFGQRIFEFGESVLWKQPAKGPQHDVDGNMGPRQFPGIIMGYNKVSNTYRIIDANGNVAKSRSAMARPFEMKWDAEALKNVVVTPWSTRKRGDAVKVAVGEQVVRSPAPPPTELPNPRRLKITKAMLRHPAIGTTENCPQCRHFRSFGETKDGLGHSELCRQRILEAMGSTPAGRAKLERYEERVDQAIAERIREADELKTAAAPATPVPPMDAAMDEDFPGGQLPGPSEHMQAPGGCGIDATMGDAQDGGDECMGIVRYEDECLDIMEVMGCQGQAYRRETRRAMKRVITEIYSPPRVTHMASLLPNYKLLPGFAFDISCADPDDGKPWDFDQQEKRDKARRKIREQKPLWLVGSPMCTAWCSWQRLNRLRRDPEVCRRELVRARIHLDFVMELYREQVEGGRFFLHEHPASASSWMEQCVNEIRELEGVDVVTADQCQYGSEVQYGFARGAPVKKPTSFMSNAPALLAELRKRCQGHGGACSRPKGGRHQICEGRVARDAAKYSKQLCRAILKGMHSEMRIRGIVNSNEVGLNAVTDDHKAEEDFKKADSRYSGKYRDDLTGQVLRDDLVREARAKELQHFFDKGVWVKRPRPEAKRVTGKPPISVRWVDVNKGDDVTPRYRSRLVARQMKAHDRSGASFFAPTPPLEALRTVISLAASTIGPWRPIYDPNSPERMQLSVLDISRAYFNAKTDPENPTYVALPLEDEQSESMCALLKRHMYGTRAAADGWQEEYSSFLVESLGFVQGTASACLFRQSEKGIALSVHGDDFTAAGSCSALDWFESEMKKHYELTIQPRLGPGRGDAKEAIVLNRVIRWTEHGIEIEADPRQAEKLITECGMEGTNTVATPGVRAGFEQVEHDKPLEERLHTAFRGAAARANYLAADRLDVQFAAKEVCRWMAKPTESSWAALKRLCRYLVGLPRMVYVYRWQTVNVIDVYTDTDWAGCPRTRKSTSGGCVLLGSHTTKTWSSTQASIALSSGEAEFNGVVRGSGVGLGYRSLLKDLGHTVPLRVWTDSSCALGICARQGLGKVRHLDTHTLWIQQAVRSGQVDLRKVDGDVNPADVFTKHSLSRERLMKLTDLFSSEFRGGRAASAAQTRKAPGTRVTMADMGREEVAAVVEQEEEEKNPFMPHRRYSESALNELFPSIKVPPAADEGDPLAEVKDELLERGLAEAEEIVRMAEVQGRLRRAKEA